MAYCINCGRSIETNHRFCAVCGADQNPKGHYSSTSDFGRTIKENDKALAIISYIGILSLVSYFVTPKKESFARFHAIQGINLFIFECIVSVSTTILKSMFSWVWPIRVFTTGVTSIAGIGLLILAIVGLVGAAKGEMNTLPVIGSWKIVKE